MGALWPENDETIWESGWINGEAGERYQITEFQNLNGTFHGGVQIERDGVTSLLFTHGPFDTQEAAHEWGEQEVERRIYRDPNGKE